MFMEREQVGLIELKSVSLFSPQNKNFTWKLVERSVGVELLKTPEDFRAISI